MKMFLFGMLVMYLGTSIITLLVGSFTEMCQRGLLNTCDCTECPLYKDFGDGQNICLKLLEEKKE